MRAIPPTDKSLSDLTTDDIAAKAQADTMANTALLQSGLSGMNDWWTPAETFGKALVNKEITKTTLPPSTRIGSSRPVARSLSEISNSKNPITEECRWLALPNPPSHPAALRDASSRGVSLHFA